MEGEATPPPPPPDEPKPTVARHQIRGQLNIVRLTMDREAPHYSAWMDVDGPTDANLLSSSRTVSMTAGAVLPGSSPGVLAPLWQAALVNLQQVLLRHLAAARVMGVGPVAGLP